MVGTILQKTRAKQIKAEYKNKGKSLPKKSRKYPQITGALFLYAYLWSLKQASIRHPSFFDRNEGGFAYVKAKQEHLADLAATTQTTISQWLKLLEDARLIDRKKTTRTDEIFVLEPTDDYYDLVRINEKVAGWDYINKCTYKFPVKDENKEEPEDISERPKPKRRVNTDEVERPKHKQQKDYTDVSNLSIDAIKDKLDNYTENSNFTKKELLNELNRRTSSLFSKNR